MREIGIVDYLNELDYDFKSVKNEVIRIGDKTAIRRIGNTLYRKNYERAFLICALAQKFGLTDFLEFGTGRGFVCACLASMCKMDSITTVDRKSIPEAISLIQGLGINTSLINGIEKDANKLKGNDINGNFDLFFIDAQHDGKSVELNSRFAKLKGKDRFIIVFDDYRNKFPSIKRQINKMFFKNKILVHTDGWIIPNLAIKESKDADQVINNKEFGSGLVVCSDSIEV